MSDPHEKSTEDHTTPAPSAATFVITREMFDQVSLYRMRYIMLFIAIIAWWIITRLMIFFMAPIPPEDLTTATNETVIETAQPLVDPAVEATAANSELSMVDFEAMSLASGVPTHILIVSLVLLSILYVTFYYNFTKAARIMGWSWWLITPSLLVISIPILGILPMGVMDRRLADQWDNANNEHERYREKIYPGDIQDEDEE